MEKNNNRAVILAIAMAGASLSLSACVGPARHAAASRPAPRLGYATPTMPRPAPVLATPGDPSAAVWGVRSGLNVAALSCRGQGRRPVAGAYATMLTHHRDLLAAAYRREQDRQGKAFDRQQTRVYNTFSNQASPARFCTAASAVAQRANGLTSTAFATAAPRLLGELQASLN